MAQVTFNTAGAGATGTTSLSVPYPSSLQAGDVILLCVNVGNTTSTPTTPANFSLLFGPDTNGTSRGFTYWKQATGSETGNLSVTTNASQQCMGRMFSFRNAKNAGTIYEGAGSASATLDIVSDVGVTTTGIHRLAINITYAADDRDFANFTGETGGDWTQAVAEYANTTGTPDGTIDLQIATMASAGTINGGASADLGTAFAWVVRGFALLPNDSPTVALNTTNATDFGSDTTPTIEFTGTDAESNDIRYNAQISLSGTFLRDYIKGLSNLVAYYPLNETSGDAINNAPATAGSFNGSVINAVQGSAGQVDEAYTFDGNGDHVKVTGTSASYPITKNTDFSITFLAKNSDLAQLDKKLVSDGNSGANSASFQIGTGSADGNRIRVFARRSDNTITLDQTTPSDVISDNNWHLITVTCSNTALTIYVDNASVHTASWTRGTHAPDITSIAATFVGGTAASNQFNGLIQHVAFFSSVLTLSDVTNLYNKIFNASILNKVSGTDAGFTNTVTGGDTDPFNSGEKVSYTVQAGNALSNGTYYWRVRGKDPAGSNTYGEWAASRSFIISNPSPTVALNSPSDAATISDTTPTLNFTGTDSDGDTIEYNVQIDTVNTFDGVGGVETFYVDGHTSITDTSNNWNNDANAFDGDTGTSADTSAGDNLVGVGTNAPSTGNTISQVRMRFYGSLNGGSFSWSSYATLSTPSGGWTWAKVQALEARLNRDFSIGYVQARIYDGATHLGTAQIFGFNTSANVAKVEVEVTSATSPLLDKFSTSDAGFTAGHPFASGAAKDFTVQAGDTLAAGTYYWRVRGIDPSPGGNTYGSWSTVRSFTVSVNTTTNQTILGKARITKSVSQTILGRARIRITTTQTIQGLAKISVVTNRTIQGLSRIQKSVSQTVFGRARIQKTVNQTVQGIARIRKVVSSTISGIARITKSVSQTIQGKARITTSTSRTVFGKARLQKTVSQIIQGLARITASTNRTITGKARITASTLRTIAGKARLQKTVSQTIQGIAKITAAVTTVDQDINGIARIRKSVNQTIQGLARITASTLRTVQGRARITAITTRTILGLARLQKAVNQTIQGKARIMISIARTVAGKARITAITTRTIQGIADIKKTTSKTILGISRIQKSVSQTITGVARITASANRTITGKAAIRKTVNRTIQGISRIQKVVDYTISGKAAILGAANRTISGIARIRVSVSRTIQGVARIQRTASQTVLGRARISVSIVRTILGRSRITSATNQTIQGLGRIRATAALTIQGKARIQVLVTKAIQGIARISSAVSQTITGKARILTSVNRTIVGKARISASTIRTVLGKARITTTTNKLIQGIARINLVTLRTIQGRARIRTITVQTIPGVSRVQKAVLKIITGLAAIRKTTAQVITGKANIVVHATQNRTIFGIAKIKLISNRTITGKARIKSKYGMYRRTRQLFNYGGKILNKLTGGNSQHRGKLYNKQAGDLYN